MDGIEALIPHRHPFLFVDRIETATEERIVGYRRDPVTDFIFAAPIPGHPIGPGVIPVETMAQCGGAGVKLLHRYPEDAFFYLASIEKARFRNPVFPGTEVRMEIRNLRLSSRLIKQAGIAFVNGDAAAEAEWLCVIREE